LCVGRCGSLRCTHARTFQSGLLHGGLLYETPTSQEKRSQLTAGSVGCRTSTLVRRVAGLRRKRSSRRVAVGAEGSVESHRRAAASRCSRSASCRKSRAIRSTGPALPLPAVLRQSEEARMVDGTFRVTAGARGPPGGLRPGARLPGRRLLRDRCPWRRLGIGRSAQVSDGLGGESSPEGRLAE
jgi:hypothetical protein